MNDKRRALGRGLGALIPGAPSGARPTDVFFHQRTAGSQGATGPVDRWLGEVPATTPDENGHGRSGAEPSSSVHPSAPQSDAPAAPTNQPDARDGHAEGLPGGDVATAERDKGFDDGDRLSAAPRADDGPDLSDGGGADDAGDDGGEPADGPALLPVVGARFELVPVQAIRPNPRQPRTVFDEGELEELTHSIAEIGVLQPVVVRELDQASGPSEAQYELVMGERRWRACMAAGLDSVPAIVRDTPDDALLRDALLENLHRSQLNPLEEAAAYQQLLEDFGGTHEELATRLGRSRPQISNTIRLLRLPPLVARRVASGVLSAGHARALLAIDDAAAIERLAQRIVAEGLSVRSVEEIVSMGDASAAPARRERRTAEPDSALSELASALADRLDTRVQIMMGQRKGRLSVDFASVEDLHRILALLATEPQPA